MWQTLIKKDISRNYFTSFFTQNEFMSVVQIAT